MFLQKFLLTNSRAVRWFCDAAFKKPIADYEQILPNVQIPKMPQQSETIRLVAEHIAANKTDRLFAVVHVHGKQFKVTDNDLIVLEGSFPPTSGDRIRLEKVLLVGARDFTLVGRPLVQDGLVDVQATVIEKSISHTRVHFRKIRRKQYMRTNFYRTERTMLRINSIEIGGELNKAPDTRYLPERV